MSLLVASGLLFGACGNDDDTADDTAATVEDFAEGVGEAARNAWASFRTGFERLIDDAATGDNEAQNELLEECRDRLQELREADDPNADRMGELCDEIRDADDDTAWDDVRRQFQDLDSER